MLIICPTPIGNLDDITPRQLQTLREADAIACEDTRTTGKLLELLGIGREERGALVSYHDHNATQRVDALLAMLGEGKTVALVSDAGTPTISDPGYRLIHAAAEAGHTVCALPGPVAGVVALSASGLPTDRFVFEGFLSPKSQARADRLARLRDMEITVVLYVAPHRLGDVLGAVAEVFGEAHPVCLGRELTKRYEEYVRGTAAEVLATLDARERVRGECVLVLGPGAPAEAAQLDGEALDAAILALLRDGERARRVRDLLSERAAISRGELYARINELKRDL